MRNSLLISWFIYLSMLSYNADAQVGVRMGIHSFDVSTPKDIVFGDDKLEYKSSELGFHGGIFGRLNLSSIFLETRIMLHSTKVNYTLDGANGTLGDNLRSESFTALDIPLLIGFDLLFLDVSAGPVAHFHLNATSDLLDYNDYEAKFETATYGWRAGLGFDIGEIGISLEYEGNFSKFGEHITVSGQNLDFGDKPSRVLLSLNASIF